MRISWARPALVAAVVVALAGGGTAVALADTSAPPTPAPSSSAPSSAPAHPGKARRALARRAEHGEVVLHGKAGDRTVDVQRGVVTAASPDLGHRPQHGRLHPDLHVHVDLEGPQAEGGEPAVRGRGQRPGRPGRREGSAGSDGDGAARRRPGQVSRPPGPRLGDQEQVGQPASRSDLRSVLLAVEAGVRCGDGRGLRRRARRPRAVIRPGHRGSRDPDPLLG